ncbi:ABC transporter substrate-binding protein [Pendulispora brunnea]|uniref:ABC transporter substrate-binding protein n=1 Tax=Pendulispora brunnea TaxID=2905690 RepID=A0ABZ2KMW0_9BACT
MKFFSKVFLVGAPVAIAALVGGACSTEFSARECKIDGDCGSNLVCVQAGQEGNKTGKSAACVQPDQAPLNIGLSAVGNGPSQDLGLEMKAGINLAFKAQNDRGGVRGRTLILKFEDDGYDPATAEEKARELLDVQSAVGATPRCQSTTKNPQTAALYPDGVNPVSTNRLDRGSNAVLAILGNVGTPTMARFAPIAVETQTLFFGAFTGAKLLLRDETAGPECKKFIFNVRASYAQEARATMEYFIAHHSIKDYKHLISFDQNDSYGQAGFSGLIDAYNALQASQGLTALPNSEALFRSRYTRDSVSSAQAEATKVINYIKGVVDADSNTTSKHTFGILMTDTYPVGEAFIKAVQDWRSDNPTYKDRTTVVFSNVSFVGPNSLANRLKALGPKYTENVLVSQVVPNYAQDQASLVQSYNDLTSSDPTKRNFTSFEGYIAGRVFIAGLLQHNGAITSESLINTFEHLSTGDEIGLGTNSGFSPSDHNYSKSVWGTRINADGSFSNAYFWREGTAITIYI